MDNYLCMPFSEEALARSKSLGYENTYFLGRDFVFVNGGRKEILKGISKAKGKITICKVKTEEMLRFVLERTNVDVVMGVEKIHYKDSVHYVRGGIDQVIAKLAKGKKFIVSFKDILDSKKREDRLRRIAFNSKICKKYGVSYSVSGFFDSAKEIRTASDLKAFSSVAL